MSDHYYYSSFVGFLGFKSCTPHSLLQPPRPLPHTHNATQCGFGDAVCVADTLALPSAYTQGSPVLQAVLYRFKYLLPFLRHPPL